MKEQRTKQILICLAASLGCFWLGNRAGLLYVSAAGTVTQRLAAAVNLSKIVLHPLQLSSAPIPVGCGVGAILLAGLAYLCIKYSGHRLVPQKEYGSARWGTAADIAPFLHEKASENIPLTATESLSLAMKMPVTAENNYNRNKNVIVFGPSGSGKSYSVAGPQLLQFNSNYVLSDPKGELLDTYGNVLLSQGYDVKVFNLKDRDKSDHYNPFAYIHDTDDIVVVSYDWLLAEDDLTTKDFISPSSYNWHPEHDDSRAVYRDRYQFGDKIGKTMYLRGIAPEMKNGLFSMLSDYTVTFANATAIPWCPGELHNGQYGHYDLNCTIYLTGYDRYADPETEVPNGADGGTGNLEALAASSNDGTLTRTVIKQDQYGNAYSGINISLP